MDRQSRGKAEQVSRQQEQLEGDQRIDDESGIRDTESHRRSRDADEHDI
jgi:hypothetical protein